MKSLIHLILIFFILQLQAQQVDGLLVVNSELVNQTNQQIFKTLEQSLNTFINNTAWTNEPRDNNQKVRLNMALNLNGYNGTEFQGTLQVQIERPVFQSTFTTPIFNYLDKDISFSYEEYQPMFFNAASFESNLVSLISFYMYMSLGVEADTFSLEGGTPYLKQAQQIMALAQQSNKKGWNQADGSHNRFWLIDTMLSSTFNEFRKIQYGYHRDGLDWMVENPEKGKQGVIESISKFQTLYNRRPNAMLIQLFFDTKADEIVDIFSGGPTVDFKPTLDILNRVAPFFSPMWKRIKY